jgi:hypothetical protein
MEVGAVEGGEAPGLIAEAPPPAIPPHPSATPTGSATYSGRPQSRARPG